ncbi:MAG: DUF6438 domain-containing protein [Saprospiraceae bacterium]
MLKYLSYALFLCAVLTAVSCNRTASPSAAATATAGPALPADRPRLSADKTAPAPPQAVSKTVLDKAPRADDDGSETARSKAAELPAGEQPLDRTLSRPQPARIKDSPMNPYPAGQKKQDGDRSVRTRGSSRPARDDAPAPAAASSAAAEGAPTAQASMTMRATERPAEPMATLRRTSCYGDCPVFTLSVYPDGALRYEGKRNVEMEGTYVGKTDDAMVKSLGRFATTSRYFTFKNRYPAEDEWTADLPMVVTTMNYNGFENEVQHQFGGPEALTELEQRLEELIKKTVWTKDPFGK